MEQHPEPPAPESDRLTNLAPELIEHIFFRLPLKDAVRTSILSRRWRSLWCTAVRHLNLDELQISENVPRFEKVVNGVLDLVTGPIESFKLTARNPGSHIFRWTHHALTLGATTFEVHVRHPFKTQPLPPALLTCSGLTSLALTGLQIRFPPGLQGFERLATLDLCKCVLFPEGVLGRLIANSPYLTHLEISGVKKGCLDIEISSASLCSVIICSRSHRFSFKNCPNLRSVFISVDLVYHGIGFNMADVLQGPCSELQELVLSRRYLHYSPTPRRLPQKLGQLCKLKLYLDLTWKNELRDVFCILRSSPGLRDLRVYSLVEEEVGIANSARDFWEGGEWQGLTLNQLTSVRLKYESGLAASSRVHLEFCKFLFAHSPILQDFTIKFRREQLTTKEEDEIRQDLSVLPKASRDVKTHVKNC